MFCRLLAGLIVAIAVFVKIGNPLLDRLILPDEEVQLNEKAPAVPYDPNRSTDVLGYGAFGFLKPDQESFELSLGLSFILSQSSPKRLLYLLEKHTSAGDYKKADQYEGVYENATVDILDARKVKLSEEFLSFEKTGFTLIKMKGPSKTANYRLSTDIKIFQEEIRPDIMKLFPGATRIEFTYNVVRGGSQFMDQPAAVNGPHLDYSQNDTARMEFHKQYPVNEQVKEQLALLGHWDTDDDEVQTLLGIWKPIYMNNPVCDHPLAVMDARTFHPEHERPHFLHIDFGVFTLHNLNGAIVYDPDQRWYYYSFQKDTEVLVFTQYSRGKHFANPHGSFENPNCPDDYESRLSVEMRAAVFYPREHN